MNVNGSKDILIYQTSQTVKTNKQTQSTSVQSGICDYTLSPLDVSLTHIIDFDLSFQS